LPKDLEEILMQCTRGTFSADDIKKFVRQLEKDLKFKVSYIEFMERMCGLGNKNHNPFKSVIQRLAYFVENNSLTTDTLLQRLGASFNNPVTVSKFADFLKAKVEKRRDLN